MAIAWMTRNIYSAATGEIDGPPERCRTRLTGQPGWRSGSLRSRLSAVFNMCSTWKRPDVLGRNIVQRLLIPVGRWKVQAESANELAKIRLSGRAISDTLKLEQQVHEILLTYDQAQELISTLNTALREMELQRSASMARASEGGGVADVWDHSLFRG
ncbi:hypothetical protein GCT13_13175 [Paraburkholderia sp. CNPSo 3157]|uniref:Uncharacterized protein n=1 Tax=Paraburkholderia franconis TaxID=2654983 RepID=A0A7X1TG25_9BURK|nr:hypothetical protein [Paraburkholderia franconis]MPW17861.1 hypothetical protein [Paraburkholderia franconis]